MFIDEAIIYVKAGNGGNGCVSFRREKYIPNGGPDGGDGGRGGNVIFIADNQQHGLSAFVRKKRFLAKNGQDGMGSNKSGKNGEDLILRVPVGTQIYHHDELLADMVNDGEEITIVKGGNGGWGNQHFATSIKQAPKWSKEGLRGESLKLRLELKMIADVGLVGLPNAGKSTLLSVISNAHPKIANYPFTTLEPNLGVVRAGDKTFVVADIPGLIEGASAGKGLGDRFLRHIERTQIILHLIDPMDDYLKNYKTIRIELENFSAILSEKKEMVVINKSELLDENDKEIIKQDFKSLNIQPVFISAATKDGINTLLNQIKAEL